MFRPEKSGQTRDEFAHMRHVLDHGGTGHDFVVRVIVFSPHRGSRGEEEQSDKHEWSREVDLDCRSKAEPAQ